MPNLPYKFLLLYFYVFFFSLFSLPVYSLHGGKSLHARGRGSSWNMKHHRYDWRNRNGYYHGWQGNQYGWPTYYTYEGYPVSGSVYYYSFPINSSYYYPSPSYQTNWTYPSYPYNGKYYVNDYPYKRRRVSRSYRTSSSYATIKPSSQIQTQEGHTSVFFKE